MCFPSIRTLILNEIVSFIIHKIIVIIMTCLLIMHSHSQNEYGITFLVVRLNLFDLFVDPGVSIRDDTVVFITRSSRRFSLELFKIH